MVLYILEQLELYLDVMNDIDMDVEERIKIRVSNAQSIYVQLKGILFPETINNDTNNNMSTESCSATTVERQNTVDPDRSEEADIDVDDDVPMNIQEIVDEGIEQVVQTLYGMAQEKQKGKGDVINSSETNVG